jgi:hypothetical protein
MLRLDKIEDVLKSVKKFDDIVKNNI